MKERGEPAGKTLRVRVRDGGKLTHVSFDIDSGKMVAVPDLTPPHPLRVPAHPQDMPFWAFSLRMFLMGWGCRRWGHDFLSTGRCVFCRHHALPPAEAEARQKSAEQAARYTDGLREAIGAEEGGAE